MKKSNYFIFSVFLLIFLFSCSSSKGQDSFVALINNDGTPSLVDIESLSKIWGVHLMESGVRELSNKLEICRLKVEKDEYGYILRGKDLNKKISLMMPLNLKDDKLYFTTNSTTVSCSGCTSTGPESAGDCMPERRLLNNGQWGYYCTSCSSGSCTKAVVVKEIGLQDNPN